MFYTFRPSTKKGKSNWGCLIVVFKKNGKRTYISTKIQIKKIEWEHYYKGEYVPSAIMGSQKIKYGAFALILSQLKTMLEEETDTSRIPIIIIGAKETINEYRNKKNVTATKKQKPVIHYFTDFYQEYIDDITSGKRLKYKTSYRIADSTIRGHGDTLNSIKKFEDHVNHQFTLDEINISFQRMFLQWRASNGVRPNTLAGDMYKIRVVIRAAHEMQLTKNRDYQRRDFVPKTEEVENVFLSPDMISELEDLDLYTDSGYREAINNSDLDKEKKGSLLRGLRISRRWALLRTKDLFLLGCYTGQRFSDYCRIDKNMIVEYGGKKFIKLIQLKEKKKVMIPLDNRILPILEKHRGCAPKISSSMLNKNIKLIGEILGWTWEPDFDESRMGKKAGNRFCDMLSSHTARRTFSTNAYAAGVPIQSIMAVTGHSTEEKLRTYLKLQPQDMAIMASKDFDGYIEKVKK